MAKSLVRNRHAVTKMYGLKSQLQAVSLRIQVFDQQVILATIFLLLAMAVKLQLMAFASSSPVLLWTFDCWSKTGHIYYSW